MATKGLLVVLSVLGMSVSFQANADDKSKNKSETVLKIEDAGKKPAEEDIDKEITNRQLRAEIGSKSKFSMSTSLSYQGGSIGEPFSKNRPNLFNEPVAPAVTMNGRVSGRYRLDEKTSFTAGMGVSVIQPFHEADRAQGHNSYDDKGEMDDPSIGWVRAGKVGNLQVVQTATYTHYTNQRSKEINTVGNFAYGLNVLSSHGKDGRLQIGLNSYVWGSYFDSDTATLKRDNPARNLRAGDSVDVTASQADYGIYIYPYVEYVINERLNFRTLFRQLLFLHTRDQSDATQLNRLAGNQSVGIGISVTRDVFLYPNFQFSTENLDRNFFSRFADASTVGLSATINMF